MAARWERVWQDAQMVGRRIVNVVPFRVVATMWGEEWQKRDGMITVGLGMAIFSGRGCTSGGGTCECSEAQRGCMSYREAESKWDGVRVATARWEMVCENVQIHRRYVTIPLGRVCECLERSSANKMRLGEGA